MTPDIPDSLRKEFSEFLEIKRSKLMNELKELESYLQPASLNGHSNGSTVEKTPDKDEKKQREFFRVTVGWKYKIDEVLKIFNKPLPGSTIIDEVVKRDSTISRQVAIKSIGSALTTNSKNEKSRYIRTKQKGTFHYAFNPNFKGE